MQVKEIYIDTGKNQGMRNLQKKIQYLILGGPTTLTYSKSFLFTLSTPLLLQCYMVQDCKCTWLLTKNGSFINTLLP